MVVSGCSGSGGSSSGTVAQAEPPAPGLRTNETVLIGSGSRYFDYYIPPNLAPAAPLVVLLHGGGQNKSKVIDGTTGSTGWRTVAEDEGFVLLVPNGSSPDGDPLAVSASWNDCRTDQVSGSSADDVSFVSALIDWALASNEFTIDPDRVFVTGASNGGLMSFRVALELDDRIAGAAAFIANNPVNREPSCTDAIAREPAAPLAMFLLMGTLDPLMPFDGGMVSFGNGGEVVSAAETAAFWRTRLGADALTDAFVYPDNDPTDGSTVTAEFYRDAAGLGAVAYLVADGAGHSMPSTRFFSQGLQNRDIDSAAIAWEFLSSFVGDAD